MANTRNGNTFYIDTAYSSSATELLIKGVRVPYILVSTTSTANQITLADSVTGVTKINIQNVNNLNQTGDSRLFDFREYPVLFPNGIRPVTLTNAIVTCIVLDPRS